MNSARRLRGLLVATLMVATTAACSSATGTGDLEGRSTPTGPTATTGSTRTSTPPSTRIPTPTVAPADRPAAVTTELIEIARNLRDLSHAVSSRDAMPAVASALAAIRADVKELRARAYGADKSCGAVESALSSARSNAARTAAGAAVVRSRNEVRSSLITRSRATLARLAAATTTGGRTPTVDEKAAVADARTTIDGAAAQVSGTAGTASSSIVTAQELRATAEAIAAKAC
ncbi:MAG: hypothetical protein ABIW49_08570 [Knoellia sp.]